jgi:uncharacterized protein YhbP (UPF0306 family)
VTDDYSSATARTRAQRLLAETETCTLATVSPRGTPEAATVRYVSDRELNVALTTQSTYRKYENMSESPRVALVVDGAAGNLQLEGRATELTGDAIDSVCARYIEKYGDTEYLTNDRSVFFEIETDWARLLVDGQFPPSYELVLGGDDANPFETG